MCNTENSIIDIGEHYPKQTERNRLIILSANGPQRLTIPVVRPLGNKTPTGKVKISYAEAWERDHCRAIEAAYASSPYYEHYSEEVFELINSKNESLIDFNQLILNKIIKWLELPIENEFSIDYLEGELNEFRNFNFQFQTTEYKQVDFGQTSFIENLSVLDSLFCLGPMARKLIIP